MDFNIQSCTCTFTCTNFDMQAGMTCHKYKQSLNCISRVNSNCIRYGIQQLKHLEFMTLTPFSASLHCSFPVASPAFQQLQQRMWHWKGFKPGFFTETGGKCGNLKRFHRKAHGKLLQIYGWLMFHHAGVKVTLSPYTYLAEVAKRWRWESHLQWKLVILALKFLIWNEDPLAIPSPRMTETQITSPCATNDTDKNLIVSMNSLPQNYGTKRS